MKEKIKNFPLAHTTYITLDTNPKIETFEFHSALKYIFLPTRNAGKIGQFLKILDNFVTGYFWGGIALVENFSKMGTYRAYRALSQIQ